MNEELSKIIEFLRWPLTVLVVCIHIVRVNDVAFDRFWVKDVCAIAVPAFFIISGMLFFHNTRLTSNSKPGRDLPFDYKHKLKRRIKTLLIPYLIWNAFAIVIGIALNFQDYRFTVLNILAGFWDSHYSFVHAVGHAPMDFPLWYVRDLMVCCILSPLYYIMIQRTGILLPITGVLLWMFGVNIPIVGISSIAIAFFSLGAYFSIWNINLAKIGKKSAGLMAVTVMVAWIVDAILCIEAFQRLGTLMATCLIFPIAGLFVSRDSHIVGIANRIGKYSFFVFASHALIVKYISWAVYSFQWFPPTVAYIISLSIILAICLFLGYYCRKLFPRFNAIVVGR